MRNFAFDPTTAVATKTRRPVRAPQIEVAETAAVPVVHIVETAPMVREQVSIRRPETRVSDVGTQLDSWTWENLRDYVVRQVEAIHGPFPRDSIKEMAIFRSFVSRWGNQAGAIAKFAFEDCRGMWRGAPVRIQRFCKGSDDFFAAPITARLRG